MNLIDIKDNSPNTALVAELENMLENAKSGDLRQLIYAQSYSDDSVSSGWALDNRCTRMRLLGELRMLEHELLLSLAASDENSATSKILFGE